MNANVRVSDKRAGPQGAVGLAPWSAWPLLLALIVGLFWEEVSSAVEVWWIYPTYSHCFLILPICAVADLGKTSMSFRTQTPTLATKALFAVPFVLAIWFVATIATINEVRQLAVIALVQIAILTMLGTRIYRTILFPALFLFFLVPVGQYLVPPMQRFATVFTDVGLTLLGIVHYTEGTIIELTDRSLRNCRGLRRVAVLDRDGHVGRAVRASHLPKMVEGRRISCCLRGRSAHRQWLSLYRHHCSRAPDEQRGSDRGRSHHLWLGLQCRHSAGGVFRRFAVSRCSGRTQANCRGGRDLFLTLRVAAVGARCRAGDFRWSRPRLLE